MADKETTFTFRVDEKLKNEFVKAAKASDRPASLLLRDFMRLYVQRGPNSDDVDETVSRSWVR